MTIGSKLQSARIRAGLTQEQAADQLKVSRQTISNWENDKTTPDVVYAKEISRVYGISLDALTSDSESVVEPEKVFLPVKDNSEMGRALLWCYFGVWIICVLGFWLLRPISGLAMLFGLFTGLMFPVVSAILAFLFGLFDCWPVRRYFLVFLFGVGQMLLPYLTFDLTNTVFNSGKLNPLSWTDFMMGICIGAVCITLGSLVNWFAGFLSKRLRNGTKTQIE